MITERQIVSLLALTGALVAAGFAIYQVYIAFKPQVSVKV